MNLMPSANYARLSSRLLYLKSVLPSAPTSGATPTQPQIDGVAFCAVMAGAACEHYIEDASLGLADSAFLKYENTNFLGRVGKHLCVYPFIVVNDQANIRKMVAVYGGSGFDVRVSAKFQALNQPALKDLLNIGYQQFKNQVKNNHGFALKYQFKLLSAIGADLSSLGPTFSSRVTQLATLRGEAAHKSVVAASTVPTPNDMALWMDDLIVGFRSLDRALARLERRLQ